MFYVDVLTSNKDLLNVNVEDLPLMNLNELMMMMSMLLMALEYSIDHHLYHFLDQFDIYSTNHHFHHLEQ